MYHVGVEKRGTNFFPSSMTEVLMSDLSCTKTLVVFGWLHAWGTPKRTQIQGLREELGASDW